MILRITVFVIIFSFFSGEIRSQIKETFEAEDGLLVVADHYPINKFYPYILLFHQMESSRGEYMNIAPKLNKLGFNCLAIDLRSGNEINFVRNETSMNALSGRYSRRLTDSKKDMVAAIDFLKSRTELPVILFGSAFSASLALILAKEREDVSGVLAISPGEYFTGFFSVQNQLRGLEKPVWIAASSLELKYVTELSEGIAGPSRKVFIFDNQTAYGAKALWDGEPGSNEAWLSIMVFLNNLKNTQVNAED